MKTWLLSVAAIIILTAAAGLILPEGKTSKSVKASFSLACLFVLLSPLSFLRAEPADIEAVFTGGQDYGLDGSFLYYTHTKRAEYYARQLETYLNSKGFSGITVKIEPGVDKTEFTVQKVLLNICELVILENNQHININIEITELTADYLNIEKEKVIIYD